ncbi:MAG: tRNA pseudouridine(38-40) synthase TruA [Clostridia bacterium]|nr:tRNA pseudouridine(38-40) synthase TruA [Clostridia bacterium]
MSTRIKLTLSYDGTSFCGWQKQKNGVSVQGAVEGAIFALTGERVSVIGSGRTDAGVHAKGQVASFDTGANIPPDKFYKALNTVLPDGVKALSSEKVSDDFNANRTAKRKTYEYSLYISDVEEPLKERYMTRVYGQIDVIKMRSAAKILEGEHDFKAFSATGSSVKTTVRKVYGIDVCQSGADIKISVCGNGFLYNMVRIIAGALVKIGKGEITESDILKALKTGDRTLLGETLPAKGLCLLKVEY